MQSTSISKKFKSASDNARKNVRTCSDYRRPHPLATILVFGYTATFEPSGRACRGGSYALNDPDDRAHPKAPSVPLARKGQGHNRGHAKGKLLAQANNGAARER